MRSGNRLCYVWAGPSLPPFFPYISYFLKCFRGAAKCQVDPKNIIVNKKDIFFDLTKLLGEKALIEYSHNEYENKILITIRKVRSGYK